MAEKSNFWANLWRNPAGTNPDRTRQQNLANRYSTIGGLLGPAGNVAGYALGRMLGRGQDTQNNAATSANWIANNGGLPADLAGGSNQGLLASPTAPAPQDPGLSSAGYTSPLEAGSYLPGFGGPQMQQPSQRPNLASFNAGATGGSDSRSGFSAMTGSARSTTDVGGVLAALADLGQSSTGNRAFLGLGALQEAARNGDENARMLLRQRRADREFNSNQ